jgi:hypothetical protein
MAALKASLEAAKKGKPSAETETRSKAASRDEPEEKEELAAAF